MLVTTVNEGLYIMLKISVQQKDVNIANKKMDYLKPLLFDEKGDINSNTMITGNFNTLLSLMDT